jgi:hypothetical protein
MLIELISLAVKSLKRTAKNNLLCDPDIVDLGLKYMYNKEVTTILEEISTTSSKVSVEDSDDVDCNRKQETLQV